MKETVPFTRQESGVNQPTAGKDLNCYQLIYKDFTYF